MATKFGIWVLHIAATLAVFTQVTNLGSLRCNLVCQHFSALGGLAKEPRVHKYFILDAKQWSYFKRSYPTLSHTPLSYITKSFFCLSEHTQGLLFFIFVTHIKTFHSNCCFFFLLFYYLIIHVQCFTCWEYTYPSASTTVNYI